PQQLPGHPGHSGPYIDGPAPGRKTSSVGTGRLLNAPSVACVVPWFSVRMGMAVSGVVEVVGRSGRCRLGALVLYLELNRYVPDAKPGHLGPNSLQNVRMRGQLGHDRVAAHRHQP